MIRLPITRRCCSTHFHRRRDTGEAIKVQCERERGHRGDHYWWPDAWTALDGEQRPSKWRRNPACVERWPDCADGEYNPACCRFPKACSCDEPADAALDGAE